MRQAVLAAALFALVPLAAAQQGGPSRPPVKGCTWETIADAAVGLEAWVQRCDFKSRKIDFLFRNRTLAVRFSDGGDPDPLVEVFDRLPGESPQAGAKRVFEAHTEASLAARCSLADYRGAKPPAGVRRYTFVPKPAYERALRKQANPNEVGDPPCGNWGTAPDGIQYFEVRPSDKARKLLFVRVGQDEPLFDERTLRPIGPAKTEH